MALPDGWIWTTIGEITELIKKVKPSDNPNNDFIYLDISSIDNSKNCISSPKTYKGLNAPSRARQLVQTNDVLFSTVRVYLKNISLVPDIYDGQIASTGFSVLRAKPITSGKFLFYYSLTNSFIKSLSNVQRGTSYPAVRDIDVRDQLIPLPPRYEQERIIAKIEELFTQLDAGVASLKRVKAGIKRYKASVLKAAVEGRLVGGKSGIRNEELPEGWQLVTLHDLSADVNYGTSQKCDYNQNEYPVIRISNIISGKINLSELKYAIEGSRLRERDSLTPGDLLIIRTNGSKNLIGKSALITKPFEKKYYFASYLIRYKIHEHEKFGAWIALIWDSPYIRKWIEKVVSTTAGQYNLNIAKLNKLPIPLPPLDQQKQIVDEVERRLSLAEQVESVVEDSLIRADRLRQSILKSAFSGELIE
jgi:type I restriction enzyme, S subunit